MKSALNPDILGRLLLVQNTLHVMTEELNFAQFICSGLGSVPGIKSIEICIEGRLYSSKKMLKHSCDKTCGLGPIGTETTSACALAQKDLDCLSIRTSTKRYGYFIISVSDQESYELYRPHVQNVANLAGLMIENKLQEDRLIKLNSSLEQRVRERTQELKKLNAYLQQSRENLKVTLQSIGDAVIATDLNGNITVFNQAAEELTGFSSENAINKHFSEVLELYDGNTKEKITPPVEDILASRNKVDIPGKLIIRNGDRESIVSDSASPIFDSANHLVGAVMVMKDISKQEELEQELAQSRKMDAIGQLAGGVAHDFNNMLTGIMGSADLLSKHLDGKDLKLIKLIIQSAERASELTANLLSFGRKTNIILSPVNIHRSLSNIVELLKRSIDKKISLNVELRAPKSIVLGDDAQIQSAFLNICINASHAMPDGGRLDLSTDNIYIDQEYCSNSTFKLSPGNYIKVDIRDTGTGITESNLSKIFEPFFTTKEQGKGTGLGLAAVYGTIQTLNGEIKVESKVGEGSVFHLMIPLAEEVSPEEQTNQQDDAQGTGKILVVDDEELIRLSAGELLKDMDYNVITAANGFEAVDIYKDKREQIDLIILDMLMPGIDGYATFQKLKEIKSDVKVIISSGFSNDEQINSLRDKGVCGFLKKPFHYDDLAQTVTKVLSQGHSAE